jgi:CBS domain-containing protein
LAETAREVMTRNPAAIEMTTTVQEAAQMMRDRDIGDILVMDGGSLAGILTDRDIVVRCVGESRDPKTTKASEICSRELYTVGAGDSIQNVVDLMMRHHVRRVPVVESERPVGIIAIGDLAVDRDPKSALGKISGADPNR